MLGAFNAISTAVLNNAGIVAFTFFVTTCLAVTATTILWRRVCRLEDRNHDMAVAMLDSQQGNTEAMLGVKGLMENMDKTLDKLFSIGLNAIQHRRTP